VGLVWGGGGGGGLGGVFGLLYPEKNHKSQRGRLQVHFPRLTAERVGTSRYYGCSYSITLTITRGSEARDRADFEISKRQTGSSVYKILRTDQPSGGRSNSILD